MECYLVIKLNILKILHNYSDKNHRLSQKDIIDKLEKEYEMKVDRKTVKRNLKELIYSFNGYNKKLIGYKSRDRQVKNRKTGKKETIDILSGFYMKHTFTDGELRLLIESLLFNKYIPYDQREKLIGKLEGLSSKYFNSRINHIRAMSDHSSKNHDLFKNIGKLDQAINNSRQVSFNYNKYTVDKRFQPQLNSDGTVREYIVNPYQMVATNGRYYLLCNYDKYDDFSHYRLDRITNIKILESPRKSMEKVKGLEASLNLPKHMAEHIYMFAGESQGVTIRFKKHFINELADWFDIKDITFFDDGPFLAHALYYNVYINSLKIF